MLCNVIFLQGVSVGGLCGCAITLWVMFGAATVPPDPILPPGPMANCSAASPVNITSIPAMSTLSNSSGEVLTSVYVYFY